MKHVLPNALLMLVGLSGSAFAAGGEGGGGGVLVALFFAFLAIIVVCQLAPGLVLFGAMVKGLFVRAPEENALFKKGGKSA